MSLDRLTSTAPESTSTWTLILFSQRDLPGRDNLSCCRPEASGAKIHCSLEFWPHGWTLKEQRSTETFFSASGLFGSSQNASSAVVAATERCCFMCTISWWIIKRAQWSRETPVQLSRLQSLCRSSSLQLHLQLRRSIPTCLGLSSASPRSTETHTRTGHLQFLVEGEIYDTILKGEQLISHLWLSRDWGQWLIRSESFYTKRLQSYWSVSMSARAFLYTSSSGLSLQGRVSQGDQ